MDFILTKVMAKERKFLYSWIKGRFEIQMCTTGITKGKYLQFCKSPAFNTVATVLGEKGRN